MKWDWLCTEGRVIVRTETRMNLDQSSLRRIKPQQVSQIEGTKDTWLAAQALESWESRLKLVTASQCLPMELREENGWGIVPETWAYTGSRMFWASNAWFHFPKDWWEEEHGTFLQRWRVGPLDQAVWVQIQLWNLTCSVSWTNHVTSWFFNMHIGEMGTKIPPIS